MQNGLTSVIVCILRDACGRLLHNCSRAMSLCSQRCCFKRS